MLNLGAGEGVGAGVATGEFGGETFALERFTAGESLAGAIEAAPELAVVNVPVPIRFRAVATAKK